MILSEGLLFLLVNETPVKLNDKYRPKNPNVGQERGRVATEFPWNSKERKLTAVRAATGEILWRKSQRVVPTTLAANRDRLLFHDGEKVVCLNRENGDELWTSKPVERRRSIPTSFAPNLIVYQSVVLFSGGNRSMTALSATTGETLWTADHARSGHNSPEDLLVVGGLVWSGATAAGKDTGVFTGRDLKTGEIKSEFPPDVSTHWFHQRCYRSKATDQYLLPSRTGIEFVDHEKKHWIPHHWVRGGCMYGIMPCNGLVYTPPHSCACYLDAKLSGFCALAPASSPSLAVSEEDRLERGPAYGQAVQSSPAASDRDWPTYRHDAARSGRTAGTVSAKLKQTWQVDLGGKLSSVVIAGGKVFVASVDTHTVHALDADSGTTLWSYTTGGRVDSPPTIHQGRAFFGSADGWVTCLRASDGELIWRFRAAPRDRRLVSYEQLESVWPVSGSVLIQDGRVYFVAGRSMFLDGGLRLCQLDPKTGRKISETVLDDRDPESGGNLQVKVKTLNMPTALPDVLSGDGRHVYMRTQRFDLQGHRQEIGPLDVTKQKGEGVHLFSPAGFLDGSWFHRSFFVYGKSIASGAGGWFKAGRNAPAGRLLVVDDSSVYGYGRKPKYFKWSTPLEYHLFATNKSPEIIKLEQTPAAKEPEKERQAQRRRRRTGSSAAPRTQVKYKWSRPASVHAMGLVLAGETLFLAGPPDILDEDDAIKRSGDRELRSKLEAQARAFEGKSGASLWAVSRANGQKLAEYKLDDPPVWDGMAAANGSLYLSTTGGKVLRMSSE